MKKNYALTLIAFLCFVLSGYGQIPTTIDFESNLSGYSHTPSQLPSADPSDQYFYRAIPSDAAIYEGSVGPYTNVTGSWMFVGSNPNTINSSNPGILTLNAINVSGYTNLELSIDWGAVPNDWDSVDGITVEYRYDGTGSWSTLYSFGHNNGTNDPLVLSGNAIGGSNTINGAVLTYALQTITTENFAGSGTNLNLRIVCDSGNNYEAFGLDNIVLNGTASCTDTVDFNNAQSPATGNITVGGVFNVYAQVFESGVTDSAGQGANIESWIGYSSSDTDPSGSGWTWVVANYNIDVGNNDEYALDLGAQISTSGTYYYASRFRLNNCGFTYGGFDSGGGDGFWDGTNDVNGVLTVNPDQVDFCNVDFPKTGAITTGDNFNVYAHVYEPGVTNAAGQGANVLAWIGYNTIGINHQPWVDSGSDWTWIPATYDSDIGNNDQYVAEIGSGRTAGTYYYASRFQLNGSDYSYGGIALDNTGNFWDATNNNGTLTVTDPPPANVVITEIMYNSIGTDDEWIEICNESGAVQNISGYIINIGASAVFTFPALTNIANGTCITVSLGSDGDGSYNNDDCVFTPDFGILAVTNNSNNLVNGSNSITLYASNGSTVVDVVTYSTANGADGNGSSLHVIDINANNSNTGTNWQEVAYGGTHHVNDLVPICVPMDPDINVEGNVGTFPDIAGDGSNIPVGFNNTLFAATPIGTATPPTKSYRIQNTGTVVLNISSITLSGANFGDFTVSSMPTTVNPGSFETFDITFNPSGTGARTALVSIDSDDPDAFEDPYEFNIKGTGVCTASTISVSGFAPLEGPAGTEVTITGNGFSATSTVTIGGLSATVLSGTATQLVVEIPAITNSGPFTITEGACFTISSDFILTSDNANCGLSELIMSEIYDQNGGSLGYIEVYNGTGNTIDLSSYYVRRYGNAQNIIDDFYTDYYFSPNQDFIDDGEVIYGKISTDTDTATPDFAFTNVNGFAGINGEDIFHLYNATTLIDVYTVPNNGVGYTATRNTNTLGPNATENPTDWTHNNIEFTSNLGTFNYVQVIDIPLIIDPVDFSGCSSDAADFQVTATAGNNGNTLTYQWYYNEGNATDLDWEVVTGGAFPLVTVSGINANTLTLTGEFYDYNGYQFYCLVTEDGACGIASNAAQLKIETAIWSSSAWSTPPTIDKIAIINDDYDTSIGGTGLNAQTSFEACQLIVNSGNTLSIENNTYVRVQNNLTVDGQIVVKTDGSFVQVDDSSIIDGAVLTTRNKISVEKETAPLATYQEYTYWSSPTFDELINNGLSEASATRRFWFNAQNFLDSCAESGNDDVLVCDILGVTQQDDIDDDNNDWTFASGVMTPGVGYASTHNSIGFIPNQYIYIFEGPFNNGAYNIPIYRNDAEDRDNNWNFIGNPYPSAISADLFLAANGSIDQTVGPTNGAIFFWSHNTGADGDTNGNQVQNYSQSDYAIINGSGQTMGGDMVMPTRHIPSGQGFFISMDHNAPSTSAGGTIRTTDVIFNNSMRVTGNNNQFFRNSNISEDNKLWLDLTSDNGVFNQILVAYVNGATNDDDGMYYDAHKNLSANANSVIYSFIESSDKKFAIQGKTPSSLTLEEVIPFGFHTIIEDPTIYSISIHQLEGDFLSGNTIYLKDRLLNVVHNLSLNTYNFTSEIGEFNDRFEIVFQPQALSVTENEVSPNDVSIVELGDGDVKISVGNSHVIKHVDIIDALGRTIYKLKGNNNVEVYNLSRLSQAIYMARVTLSNGQIITKKAVKRN
ncbi:MAG: lamin tail domain-containing protein [Psychroserpens sp.]|uniref:lamin tail domain-containing protein n=1 Tax=Psychroserpens sp. TaxID=2020870 RepID=UPI0030036204